MADAKPPRRKKRWVRRVLFALLLLAILVASTVLWLGSVASTRLEAELARVRDAGEPLTLAETVPPPVPEADNAAPLLLEAFELAEWEPDSWYQDETLNEYGVDPFGQDDAWYEELAAWVQHNAPALEKAREAASRPACRFDLEWEQGVEMEFPQIGGLQSLTRVLCARAVLQARDGDVDAAVGTCADLVRLADIALREPLMIHLLVRAGLVDFALETAQQVLGRGPAATGALENLLARIEALPRDGELHRMFVVERTFGYDACNVVRDDPSKIDLWMRYDGDFGLGRTVLFRLIPDTMMELDSARYLALVRRAIALAKRPYREARADWGALAEDLGDRPWYSVVSAAACAPFPLVARKWTAHEARVDLARLGLHLELYARRHGALPDTFADLPVPLPTDDPFGDAPYVLETTEGGGWIVYSVGPDGDDDGGAPLDDDAQGDLVWRHHAHADGR